MTTCPNPYCGFRFPAEIISHAVWLYFRFPLSLRMVDELLAARGIIVRHETVRQWALKFGQAFANQVRRRLPAAGDKWHLDEVLMLSANSGGSRQGCKARRACLGAWPSIHPVHHPRDVRRHRRAGLLQASLRQADAAAPAHAECAHALRERALHPGPPVTAFHPCRICHPRPCRIQRLVVLTPGGRARCGARLTPACTWPWQSTPGNLRG